jgi:alcohol dehydrogenase (cytochrome c)
LDYQHGAQHSSGPIVANGKVISGRSCEPEGGPEACVLTAFDALTGKELWRTHTIPKPGEPGDETWGNIPYEQRRHVGLWMVPSFDPELNRIYVGTSVTSPAPKFMLAGNDKQYLYHNSTLALDVAGKIVWYLQHVVDNWDLDHPFERMLIDRYVARSKKSRGSSRVRQRAAAQVVTGIRARPIIRHRPRDGQFL